MEKIYEAVLRHASKNTETDKVELTIYLNKHTDMKITVGGLAINTIIRQSYNHYMKKKEYENAYLILDTYKPEVYIWKVINKYSKSN
ncbi:hypothetical protein LDL76_00805 [Salegentibacter mishustinae]|uniref:hypothetical protein n=1 Tax=Salegentibacter mishustinae TaxID=270918 RepID=UPI001CE06FAB|nr:hypothetical protein [Salegentibacter mishustinae]UBZ07266.1 hypothetical protein LDL76_00805 [Salegentibacter mishustinae]